MREFNIKINEEVLKEMPSTKMLEDDTLNETIRIADDILEIFRKNKTNMSDAFMILSSLADSIYMYSTFGEELS